eukprot:1682384-Rhodomonas_salina.3
MVCRSTFSSSLRAHPIPSPLLLSRRAPYLPLHWGRAPATQRRHSERGTVRGGEQGTVKVS